MTAPPPTDYSPRCHTCDGTGVSSMTWNGPNREDWAMNTCTDCEGTGR